MRDAHHRRGLCLAAVILVQVDAGEAATTVARLPAAGDGRRLACRSSRQRRGAGGGPAERWGGALDLTAVLRSRARRSALADLEDAGRIELGELHEDGTVGVRIVPAGERAGVVAARRARFRNEIARGQGARQ